MPRLLVVGELNPDIIVIGVPVTGGRLRFGQAEDLVESTTLTLGSSAALTACAAAAAGADVGLVAVVGADDLGRMCLDWTSARGVDVSAVRRRDLVPTGSSVILVSGADRGDRQILTAPGAMAELTVDDVPDDLLTGCSHLHVSSFFLHTAARERLHERMSRARALGATTSLDPNDDPAGTWGSGVHLAVAAADVIFVNDEEALGLAGMSGEEQPERAVADLLQRMVPSPDRGHLFPAVVHKHGAKGATVLTRCGPVHVPAPAVDVVDTVGAGDTLAGTVLATLLAGADWPAALSRGVAAATCSTTAAGGLAGQPAYDRTVSLAATLTATDRRTKPGGIP